MPCGNQSMCNFFKNGIRKEASRPVMRAKRACLPFLNLRIGELRWGDELIWTWVSPRGQADGWCIRCSTQSRHILRQFCKQLFMQNVNLNRHLNFDDNSTFCYTHAIHTLGNVKNKIDHIDASTSKCAICIQLRVWSRFSCVLLDRCLGFYSCHAWSIAHEIELADVEMSLFAWMR